MLRRSYQKIVMPLVVVDTVQNVSRTYRLGSSDAAELPTLGIDVLMAACKPLRPYYFIVFTVGKARSDDMHSELGKREMTSLLGCQCPTALRQPVHVYVNRLRIDGKQEIPNVRTRESFCWTPSFLSSRTLMHTMMWARTFWPKPRANTSSPSHIPKQSDPAVRARTPLHTVMPPRSPRGWQCPNQENGAEASSPRMPFCRPSAAFATAAHIRRGEQY